MKAIVVYGSESGTTKRNIEKIVADWRAAGRWEVLEVLEGEEAAADGLANIAKRCATRRGELAQRRRRPSRPSRDTRIETAIEDAQEAAAPSRPPHGSSEHR